MCEIPCSVEFCAKASTGGGWLQSISSDSTLSSIVLTVSLNGYKECWVTLKSFAVQKAGKLLHLTIAYIFNYLSKLIKTHAIVNIGALNICDLWECVSYKIHTMHMWHLQCNAPVTKSNSYLTTSRPNVRKTSARFAVDLHHSKGGLQKQTKDSLLEVKRSRIHSKSNKHKPNDWRVHQNAPIFRIKVPILSVRRWETLFYQVQVADLKVQGISLQRWKI